MCRMVNSVISHPRVFYYCIPSITKCFTNNFLLPFLGGCFRFLCSDYEKPAAGKKASKGVLAVFLLDILHRAIQYS